jgi:hypothetical protein
MPDITPLDALGGERPVQPKPNAWQWEHFTERLQELDQEVEPLDNQEGIDLIIGLDIHYRDSCEARRKDTPIQEIDLGYMKFPDLATVARRADEKYYSDHRALLHAMSLGRDDAKNQAISVIRQRIQQATEYHQKVIENSQKKDFESKVIFFGHIIDRSSWGEESQEEMRKLYGHLKLLNWAETAVLSQEEKSELLKHVTKNYPDLPASNE